ncbi:thiamine pyrophosphate-requiring protein [Natrarchaeobius halalkaliphilus]|uniref:Thiamine pyrophosphate-requiring protein n=1 Tax=Natrarchaeobius halalkaliphilus TaxID=1679091 RepID=A0A3N6LNY9_9EURY|nr:thiamine pyrophosphate-requiring protein [Natrarchaeobius halalkaliphilus]RQG87927.1 thiamine pyrophosphate-requiring protein [Natrarchaeobius halalkaliphilus]
MELPDLPAEDIENTDLVTSGEALLESLADHGVEYLFSNLGTDHTPLIEAISRIRARGEETSIPEIVLCPHEYVAMSAAHGYAAVSGEPQAVLVHVDVGTQNLGGAMHNAHRANVPVFVISGLAPVTDSGYLGSREHVVHYQQDVFDQPGIVREYCRWTGEYKPPADPDSIVARGLERATADPSGPVYLTATREALEARFDAPDQPARTIERSQPSRPTDEMLEELGGRLEDASNPVVITSQNADPDALVEFAEATGAGVVEHAPTRICFPRDHPLHLGFTPNDVFETADLILLAAVDIPWIPANGHPPADVPVIQFDSDPTKAQYPSWNFRVDLRLEADSAATMAALTEHVDAPSSGQEAWETTASNRRDRANETLSSHRDEGLLTPEVLSDALNHVVESDTIAIEDAVTSQTAILEHLDVTTEGGHFWKGGAGLGWAGSAAVGAKLAQPDSRVLSLVGDGSYLFSHPTVTAWLSASMNAPTLTVIYNNGGWRAVQSATLSQYPDGSVATEGLRERTFDPAPDLPAAATVVDAYTATVDDEDALIAALDEAVAAMDEGRPAILDVHVDDPSA